MPGNLLGSKSYFIYRHALGLGEPSPSPECLLCPHPTQGPQARGCCEWVEGAGAGGWWARAGWILQKSWVPEVDSVPQVPPNIPEVTHRHGMCNQTHICFLKNFIYLFLERGEGREKKRERNLNGLPLTLPTGCLAHNTGMCPDQESIRQPLILQD